MGTYTLRKRELLANSYLPFLRHADDHTIITTSRGAFQVMRLKGVAFRTADNKTINVLHERLANAIRQIADDNVMIYSHIIRREDTELPEGELKSGFGAWMDTEYIEHLVRNRLYVNDLYVTVYIQPRGLEKLHLSDGVRKARKNQTEVDSALLEQLKEATAQLKANLHRYGPEMLGMVKNRRDVICSEPMTFLRELISGSRSLMPLVRGPIGHAIYTDRVLFGSEAFEIRHAGASTVGGILGMKDLMPKTRPTMFDELLTAPFRFVLAQSFRFLDKGKQLDNMLLKQGRMDNANDAALSQADELTDARDELMSNAWVMGEHNLSLTIFARTIDEKQSAISDASRMLSDNGIIVAREDLGLESAFWAMLPGNHRNRLRLAQLNSKNFAALSSLHNFPSGQSSGNFWGPAIAKLKTTSGGPYFLNVHKGDLGHTFVCGPSGSGKTVFQLFMMSQLEKFGAKRVLFDKDRGGAIFVRASGGDYLDFKVGKPTGCAPFKAIPIDPTTQPFFIDLIKSMVGDEQHPFTASDNARIESAVQSLSQIGQSHRSVSVVREVLGTSAGEGDSDIGTRFEKWCEGGRLAWVFEGETDQIGFDSDLLGFDVTDFLDAPEIRTPIMLYLLYRVRQLINGQKIAIFIDEFWKSVNDPVFVEFAKDLLKVLRKQNGFMVMGTQDPSDVIASSISRTIINQCATTIFFPSEKAKADELVGEFGLSHREYTIIRSELRTGQFLIKQGQDAVVCELDLKGLDDALAVLSGRTETVALMDRVIQQHGANPEAWLPAFHIKRREQSI